MKKVKIILFLIIFTSFLLRLPSLWEPIYYGDECIYLTLGQAFNKGMVFYKRVFDHKPPLIYLTTALAGGELAFFRSIAIIWNIINIYLVYLCAQLLVKQKQETAGVIAAFLFALFSFLPEGRIANGELFMIMPATLGLLLALKSRVKQQAYLWLGVGLSFSIAFLYKPPIALDFAGLCLAFFIYNKNSFKEFLTIFKSKRLYLLLLGFFAPILLSVFYYWGQGAATPYIRSALLQNIGYISSWGGGGSGELMLRSLILLTALIILWLLRKKLSFNFYLLALMTLMAGFGAFLSERPYPHYLIQLAPWTALLLTQLFLNTKIKEVLTAGGIFGLIITGVVRYDFWWYPILPYYQNFYKFSTGQKSRREYFDYFEQGTFLEYQMAKYLQAKTNKNENIFAWSNSSSCIYALSNRTPPGRYVTDFHISDFGGKKETIQTIKENPPKLVILDFQEHREFKKLINFVKRNYLPSKKFANFQIYKRKNE